MKKRLLIIEDHEEFRSMVRAYVARQNWEIEIYEASTGEMGLAKASCVKPDIILMDISLPRMTGLEAAAAIREEHPLCDIIFLTLFDVKIFKRNAEKMRARAFIGKQDVDEQLLPAIKKCLDGKK